MSDRQRAIEMLDKLRRLGISDYSMLEHIIYNWLSGAEAVEVLDDIFTENGL
jgi:hypothetical protein